MSGVWKNKDKEIVLKYYIPVYKVVFMGVWINIMNTARNVYCN